MHLHQFNSIHVIEIIIINTIFIVNISSVYHYIILYIFQRVSTEDTQHLLLAMGMPIINKPEANPVSADHAEVSSSTKVTGHDISQEVSSATMVQSSSSTESDNHSVLSSLKPAVGEQPVPAPKPICRQPSLVRQQERPCSAPPETLENFSHSILGAIRDGNNEISQGQSWRIIADHMTFETDIRRALSTSYLSELAKCTNGRR